MSKFSGINIETFQPDDLDFNEVIEMEWRDTSDHAQGAILYNYYYSQPYSDTVDNCKGISIKSPDNTTLKELEKLWDKLKGENRDFIFGSYLN